jgi:hypothetical protein
MRRVSVLYSGTSPPTSTGFSGAPGQETCNDGVNRNIPLAGSGPAAHLDERAAVGNGAEDECLLVGGVDQTVHACEYSGSDGRGAVGRA